MSEDLPILACRDMSCQISARPQPLDVLHNIDFTVARRTALGIVGESGAGKSMLVKSIMGIAPASVRVNGQIMLDGQDLFAMRPRDRARFIGRKVGIVFQNPMTSLNPYVPVGRQIAEACRQHFDVPRNEARQRAIELLRIVGIADPQDCYDYYPHHFSGGMKQRIMIAASLICHPDLLIADEATTALDVTVQKEVLDLLQTIQEQRQMSMILVSHNLGVVAGRTDEILVLYGGHVVEYGPTSEVFRNPRHRYTEALLSAMPQMDQPAHTRLRTIAGQPPSLANKPAGCPFAPRCGAAEGPCHTTMPEMRTGTDARHRFACHFPLAQTVGPAAVSGATDRGAPAQ
jgi:peptide/nickel transport system ATP-binding protein